MEKQMRGARLESLGCLPTIFNKSYPWTLILSLVDLGSGKSEGSDERLVDLADCPSRSSSHSSDLTDITVNSFSPSSSFPKPSLCTLALSLLRSNHSRPPSRQLVLTPQRLTVTRADLAHIMAYAPAHLLEDQTRRSKRSRPQKGTMKLSARNKGRSAEQEEIEAKRMT
eukprot:753986-Hanusia_phi.AAC.3